MGAAETTLRFASRLPGPTAAPARGYRTFATRANRCHKHLPQTSVSPTCQRRRGPHTQHHRVFLPPSVSRSLSRAASPTGSWVPGDLAGPSTHSHPRRALAELQEPEAGALLWALLYLRPSLTEATEKTCPRGPCLPLYSRSRCPSRGRAP